jgi:hypothetical protein
MNDADIIEKEIADLKERVKKLEDTIKQLHNRPNIIYKPEPLIGKPLDDKSFIPTVRGKRNER